MMIKKIGALLLSVVLCIGMAAPAFAFEAKPPRWNSRLCRRWWRMLSPLQTKPLVP